MLIGIDRQFPCASGIARRRYGRLLRNTTRQHLDGGKSELSDSWLSSIVDTRIRTARVHSAGQPRSAAGRQRTPFSFIRTVTVGLGLSPSLLTPPDTNRRALAGSCKVSCKYRRWGL